MIWRLCLFALGLSAAGSVPAARGTAQSVAPRGGADLAAIVVQAYKDGLAGVRAANADVHLSVGRDPSMPNQTVLVVEYPAPTRDPAGRDVRCVAENQNWSAGRAISFHIKPVHDVRLSLSLIDRNRIDSVSRG